MKGSCVGTGHVGRPTMAVITLKCPSIEVAIVDVLVSWITVWNSDQLPIYGPDLDSVVARIKKMFMDWDAYTKKGGSGPRIAMKKKLVTRGI